MKAQVMKSLGTMISKEPNVLKGLTISDIHLGNRRNPTQEKIAKLNAAISDCPEIAALDYIFIAGDTYDNNLNHSSDEVIDIDIWIAGLLRLCKKHNIKLRVLLGTRSHDHRQPRRFMAINYFAAINADLQYIDEIKIVQEDGISILYVPDDVDRDTDKIFHQVKSKMMEQGLQKVDLAIMHGQFEHQLPAVVKAPKHNADKYLSIVNHYIFIGHVHVYSTYDRIVAQGSFDRDSHGEESPKGHVRFEINYKTQERRLKFVINKDAKIFKTLKIKQKDLTESMEYIQKQIAGKIPDGSYVRLVTPKDHPIHANLVQVMRLFPLITFTINQAEEEKTDSPNLIDEVVTYTMVEITPENIVPLVLAKVDTLTNDNSLKTLCRDLLTNIR